MDQLTSVFKKYAAETKKLREYFHQYPELSFKEVKTTEFICETLQKNGIEYRFGIGGLGILAVIKGKKAGPVVAFRADMDALPVEELNKVPYKSCNKGVMHACGHDFHTASLLSFLMMMKNEKLSFNGTILGLFQPAEEKSPGGAIAMIKDNVFKQYKPDVILAQHVFPDLPAGKVGFKAGFYMASSDEIYITVIGKGGHGALPHKLKDPLLAAAHLITSMEQINSRILKAGNPSVLTFGKFIANGAVNIIPDKVEIEGTFRAMNDDWRKEAHAKMKEVCKGISLTYGVNVKLNIVGGYPSLYNDPAVTEQAHKFAAAYLKPANAVELEDIRMTAEDFSYFGKEYPSCMYRLGVAHTDGKTTYPLHSACFDIDEKAYLPGMAVMYHMVMGFLSQTKKK